jgi:hypothetical protein
MNQDDVSLLARSVTDLPPGSHVCHFYDTTEDLLYTLVPFFAAGLERHEFCVWVTSPVTVAEASAAMWRAIPELDRHLAEGDLVMVDARRLFMPEGDFNGPLVLEAWRAGLEEKLARGYTGMRVNGTVDPRHPDVRGVHVPPQAVPRGSGARPRAVARLAPGAAPGRLADAGVAALSDIGRRRRS